MSALNKGAKSVSNELEKIWEKYRVNNAINFSDVIEDRTIYETSCPSPLLLSKNTFEPKEITGRSTSCLTNSGLHQPSDIDAADISVDKILGESFVEEIRNMSHIDGNSIRISMPNRYDGLNGMSSKDISCKRTPQKFSSFMAQSPSIANQEDFLPSERVIVDITKKRK